MPLPKIATPTYELELPSTGQTITYRPFLVKEEKVLVIALESEDTKQITNAIKSVIKNCITTRGIKVEQLPTFDIEYLFLNVRAKSVGETVDVNITCPDDGETQVEMSIDIDAGLAYIPTQENPFFYAIQEDYKKTGVYKRNPGRWNMGIEMSSLAQNILNNLESQPKPGGFLKAFDPLTGETKWSVPIPHYWNGGVLGTAGGLVFQGDALGMFSAYDKETGERLWEFNTYTSMLAPPITFEIDGEQYVSILTGSGGGDMFGGEPLPPIEVQASLTYNNFGRMLTFKLGGEKTLPIPNVRDKTIPEQQLMQVSIDQMQNGESNYNDYCAVCHGFVVKSAGGIPDLRKMTAGTHDAFNQIVLEGLLASNGMASFADVLSEQEVENIHHYVKARAHEDREVALGNMEAPQFTWFGQEEE